MSRTAVVILNWNTRDYLQRFLPTIQESIEGLDAEIIVADSGSTDDSMALIQSDFPEIKPLPLGKNYGFTGGYNKAFELLKAEENYDYFLLLNSDIEVPRQWLSPLVEYMDNHQECGACAPKLHSLLAKDYFEYAGAAGGLLDYFGYPYCRGRILSHLDKDNGQFDDAPANVLWATGACLLVRTKIWKKFSGLDDRFFAHMEEIDLCWRMQLEGYKVTVIPSSVVYHLGGGTLPKENPTKLKLNYRNNILLLQNNLSRTLALGALNKGKTVKKASAIGYRKANRRILFRKCLDGASGLVYLLQGKVDFFKAVIQAHKESTKLGRILSKGQIEAFLEQHPNSVVEGIGGNVFIEFFKKKI